MLGWESKGYLLAPCRAVVQNQRKTTVLILFLAYAYMHQRHSDYSSSN